ncbi:MAG: hypothetical protein UY51_C0005G0086 [Candidatus Jorgensenbacteria bacterium GW2011_GWB1_49_9]|nr:MAG: hypothetical protein UY51_C0005G0086 [Candidatus Jorgensenbacteria bacterium GW2011_GWB1_49_9]
MKARLRLIIFSAALLVFVLGGAYLVALAQGWIFDFSRLEIVKTGGLYLNFNPADAALKVNGKTMTVSRDFIGGGRLIKNLLPGDYKIDVSKNGYRSWQKNLPVRPGVVTAETHIKLWPDELKSENVSADSVSDFWLTSEGVVYKAPNDSLIFKNRAIKGQKAVLASPASNYIATSQDQNYFLTDLKNPASALNLSDIFNSLKQQTLHYPGFVPLKSVHFHPFSPDKLILATNASIYTLDLNKIGLSENLRGTNLTSVSLGSNAVFALDRGRAVLWVNLILGTVNAIDFGTSTRFQTLTVSPDGNHWLFTDENENLFLANSAQKPPLKISADIKSFSLSPDSKRVSLVNGTGALSVFFIETYDDDFHASASTTLTLDLPNSRTTTEWRWLNLPNHFLVLKDGNLIAGEIDPYLPLNFHTLTTGVKKYILNGSDLYMLNDSKELLKFYLNQ